MHASSRTLQELKRSIAKIEEAPWRLVHERAKDGLSFGISEIDSLLEDALAGNEMHEFRCSLSRDIGSVCGLVAGLLSRMGNKRPIAWISDPGTMIDNGMLFPDGLCHFGLDASQLIHIRPAHLEDAFWAVGESARLGGTAATVFHVKGNPDALDLSVSRKLMLRTRQGGSPLIILRQAGNPEASSAMTRWHVEPLPSLPCEGFHRGLGNMRLTLTLERNRNGRTGHWPVAWNHETRSFEHAAKGSAAAHAGLPFQPSFHRPHRTGQMGEVMATEWAERQAS